MFDPFKKNSNRAKTVNILMCLFVVISGGCTSSSTTDGEKAHISL
jgi:hypothetical protein